MKIKAMNIRILANILTTLCVMLAISSCNNNQLNNQLLTADECLNHEQVDSAYHILKNINQKKISDKENRVICKSPWIKVDMVALFLPQDVAQL